jgi:hypothetical protein
MYQLFVQRIGLVAVVTKDLHGGPPVKKSRIGLALNSGAD